MTGVSASARFLASRGDFNDADPRPSALFSDRLNNDFDSSAQRVEELKKPFGREPADLAAHQVGDPGLIDPEDRGGFCLGQPPSLDDPKNLDGQVCFGY